MNTPPKQRQSVYERIRAGLKTPPRPERLEFLEPPAIVRYSKMRRVGEIPDHVIQNLADKFNNVVNTK